METEEAYLLRTGLRERPAIRWNPRFRSFSIHSNPNQIRRTEVIDFKKFDKKKTTKPSEQLCAGDVGSLVKVTTADGVEIMDILIEMVVVKPYRDDEIGEIRVTFQHMRDSYGVLFGMRVVVQSPIED